MLRAGCVPVAPWAGAGRSRAPPGVRDARAVAAASPSGERALPGEPAWRVPGYAENVRRCRLTPGSVHRRPGSVKEADGNGWARGDGPRRAGGVAPSTGPASRPLSPSAGRGGGRGGAEWGEGRGGPGTRLPPARCCDALPGVEVTPSLGVEVTQAPASRSRRPRWAEGAADRRPRGRRPRFRRLPGQEARTAADVRSAGPRPASLRPGARGSHRLRAAPDLVSRQPRVPHHPTRPPQ